MEDKIEIRIDGSKAYYEINSVGSDSKTTYMGEFCFKVFLSPLDVIVADRTYRDLIGSINPHLANQDAINLAFALSQLKVRVLEYPDFFRQKPINGAHLDKNILVEILNAAYYAEQEYAKLQNERIKKVEKKLKKAIAKKEIEKEIPVEETPLE
jgi:hypothetical protein